jgi:hypothetical protein
VKDFVDRGVGLMVGGFQLALGCGLWVGTMVKETVGQGTEEALVKEQEQESNLVALVGESIGVVWAIAFQ